MDNRERLDQLGRQWMQCRATGTQAERKNLETEIFLLILQLFPKQAEAVGTLYEKDWEKFDAQEGSLYNFCSFRLPKRMDAVERKDMDGRYVRKEDEVSGKQVKYKERHTSLYKKVGEEGEGKLIEVVRQEEESGADMGVMLNSTMVELITLMLRLPQELRGRANNPQRLNYFRMFFTDSVADIAQNQEGISSLEERERDLFQVLQLAFLDFFQAQNCRTVAQLRGSQSKPYGQLVPGRPMTDPGHPLPNDVYCAYFETQEDTRIGDSALSNQRTAYKKFLGGYLC